MFSPFFSFYGKLSPLDSKCSSVSQYSTWKHSQSRSSNFRQSLRPDWLALRFPGCI